VNKHKSLFQVQRQVFKVSVI